MKHEVDDASKASHPTREMGPTDHLQSLNPEFGLVESNWAPPSQLRNSMCRSDKIEVVSYLGNFIANKAGLKGATSFLPAGKLLLDNGDVERISDL